MPAHQPHHRLPGGVIRPQTPQHLFRHGGTYGRMTVKVAVPRLVLCKAFWLANIMEQHGQPQFRFRRHGIQRMERVLPHIVAVVDIILGKVHHRQDLRPKYAHHIRKGPQHNRGICPRQQPQQFFPNTLRSDLLQQAPAAVQPLCSSILQFKSQHGSKAHSPEDPQRIFTEPLFRLSHAAQQSRMQIHSPAKGIPQIPPAVHRHGIDREIPPPQVLLQ